MKTMLQRYQNYPNGMTNNTNGVFEYLGIHLVGDERVAACRATTTRSGCSRRCRPTPASSASSPCWPRTASWSAPSGRPARSSTSACKSLYGKQATVVNPWGTQQVQVRRTSDNAILATSHGRRGQLRHRREHRLRRGAHRQAADGYTSAPLTGTANQDAKTLCGTAPPSAPGSVGDARGERHRADLRRQLVPHHGRGYGDYNDDTHHTNTVGAAAQYTFTGTGVEYLSERNGDMGNVDVYIDNVFQANVNLYVSGARQAQQVVYSKTGPDQRHAHHPHRQQGHLGRHGRRAADPHQPPPPRPSACASRSTAATSPRPAARR